MIVLEMKPMGADNQGVKRDTTLVTSSNPGDLSPIEAAIMDGCNVLHDAVGRGDDVLAESVRGQLGDLLSRYRLTRGENHPNPRWAIPNQEALVLSAAGEVEGAIEVEMGALRHADTPRRMEISAGNIADRYIRLERYEDAVKWFLGAFEHAPSSVPILMTGAQCLLLAGHASHAERILGALLARAEADPRAISETSELRAYLVHESRLRRLAKSSPALARLLELAGVETDR